MIGTLPIVVVIFILIFLIAYIVKEGIG